MGKNNFVILDWIGIKTRHINFVYRDLDWSIGLEDKLRLSGNWIGLDNEDRRITSLFSTKTKTL